MGVGRWHSPGLAAGSSFIHSLSTRRSTESWQRSEVSKRKNFSSTKRWVHRGGPRGA